MSKGAPEREPRWHLWLYVLAAVSYIAVGVVEKGILNWVLGPLWLLAVLALGQRVAARRRSTS